MKTHEAAIEVLLGGVVLCCWVGVLGMLRVKSPVKALHYLTYPATIGVTGLTAAMFVESGFGPASIKTLLIALVLLAINSVVTHATARALRGLWEARERDPIEFVPGAHHPAGDHKT